MDLLAEYDSSSDSNSEEREPPSKRKRNVDSVSKTMQCQMDNLLAVRCKY